VKKRTLPAVFFLFFFCFFSSFTLRAQTFYFENYGVKEGLAQSSVYSIIQDNKGAVWMGTSAGASRFDGLTFENFTFSKGMAENAVRAIFQTRDNKIWFGHTGGGISRFDGKKFGKITNVKLLTGKDISSIYQDSEGQVWLGTIGSGVICIANPEAPIDSLKFTVFSSHNGLSDRVFRIQGLSGHRMFFVTDVGISILNTTKHSFETYSPEGFPHYFQITCLTEDQKGNLWMGTYNGGLYRMDKTTQKFTVYDVRDGLAHNWISSLVADRQGTIWVGTWGGGITKLEPGSGSEQGYKLKVFNTRNGLPDNKIRSLVLDREGNLLIGTNENGLSVFKGELFVRYGSDSGIKSEQVWSMVQDAKSVFWMGTNAGIFFLDSVVNSENRASAKSAPFPELNQVRSLKKDKQDNIWIGTWGNGLFYCPSSESKLHSLPLINGYNNQGVVSCMELDKQNNLWLGTLDGLLLYKPDKNSVSRFTQIDGISGNDITALFCDSKGVIWIGSKAKGLSFYKDGVFAISDSLRKYTAVSITEDASGKVWVATEGEGLLAYENGKFKTRYGAENGLASDFISAVIPDDKNTLWVGTNRGINTIDLRTRQINYYSSKEGFTGIEVKANAGFKDNKGNIWFGTSNGVFKCTVGLNISNSKAPSTFINKFQVNQIERDLIPGLQLSYTEKNISFNYSGISLSDAEAVRFRVMLEGIDTAWQAESSLAYINYPSLPSGNYVFKVKAGNGQGIWNTIPAEFAFTIRPPFWKTGWFIFGCIATILLAAFTYIRFREKELVSANRILEEKVDERTAEIGRKNQELHHQNGIIEEKNKDIMDSIHCAKRLQEAILPNRKLINDFIAPYFVLYTPKDIVSGDLFWIEAVGQKVLFAAIDCTGHGVPGALVSIVAHNSLNQAVKEVDVLKPSLILDKLNDLVEETFSKSESEVQDGLDIALCLLDRKNNTLEYAGANNALYHIRNGELMEIKADKQPIGKFSSRKQFTNHCIATQTGDLFYVFTDGYADQFGGAKGKKFKYSQFEKLLLEIHTLSMEEQQAILGKTMDEWKGQLEQVDDMCIIGVRI
jgi:ligand-binding sensor domain-containing protein/serine phosphatase RsbU (regulator of sigma subunit)